MAAIDTVRRVYEAFAAGDGEALGRLLGATHWVEAAGGPYGGVYSGFGEIAASVFGPIGRDVRDFTAVPDELLPIDGDRVLALGTYGGATATGPLAIRFGHLWTVDGDAIGRFEQFTDTRQWREAVGSGDL